MMKVTSGYIRATRPTSSQAAYRGSYPSNDSPLWMQIVFTPSRRACSMNGTPTRGSSSHQPTRFGPHWV